MLQEIFETLGFKEEEVRTYLLMLERGASTAGDLAKGLGQPRPTVYGYLERLTAGGLVSRSQVRGVNVYVPEPGDKLRLLYRRKIAEITAREKMLDLAIPELERHAGVNLLRPRMQFFEGRSGMEAALEDILTAPAGTLTLSFWPINAAMSATSEDFFRYHNMERIKRDIHIHGIWPRKQGADIKRYPFMGWGEAYKRELRYAPDEVEFTMGYWVYGNKTVFISSRAESYGFIMESAELAAMMSTQHNIVWKVSTPIPFNEKDVARFLNELKDYLGS